MPRDAMFQGIGAIFQAETPVNEAPIVLLSPVIDRIWAATAREI